MTTLTKAQLVERLIALPTEIGAAEDNVLQAHARLVTAKELLQWKEDSLLLDKIGFIDGKNAETRAAQVRSFTKNERDEFADAEMNLKNAASRLERLHVQLKAYRAVADLLRVAV
ncbi:hypothetical protein [Paenibacillus ginsengarvi]|uniref:Uncharacterized protein n=1 Tax=Paenibacillus ginsengarvi TaxID=400777 RepID=A0A3B0BRF7_9BACL|nr:hypothetical protein [Paenibacillus ginsengarvi]RKN75041.1 hypothetical protein D7M11_26270 [Paenibacillus ginsengarvi]